MQSGGARAAYFCGFGRDLASQQVNGGIQDRSDGYRRRCVGLTVKPQRLSADIRHALQLFVRYLQVSA